mgnify:FL=1
MDSTWTEAFYQETDAEKRLEMLKQNTENDSSPAAHFRKKLWVARYGKKRPNTDAFIGCLMDLKCMADGSTLDLGGKKRKEAAQIINKLCLSDIEQQEEEQQEEYREILLYELKNVFLKYIEISRTGRSFTSLIFGMGQLSDEGVVKKIAKHISEMVFQAPHMICMDKDFELLQEAALLAFRQEYPNREHFLEK